MKLLGVFETESTWGHIIVHIAKRGEKGSNAIRFDLGFIYHHRFEKLIYSILKYSQFAK